MGVRGGEAAGVLAAALSASTVGERRMLAEALGAPPLWPAATADALREACRAGLALAAARHWGTHELASYVGRRLGARARRLVADAVAGEPFAVPALDDRCAREGVQPGRMVETALDVLGLLHALPRLAPVAEPPSGRAEGADARMLAKVRALLAKAESTEFPEEAEALSARAQELMARHSIDRALVADTGARGPGAPNGRRVVIDTPYEAPKAVLLTVVAEANRCRTVWHRELGLATVLGYPADLMAVELLFTSLLVQATSAMVNAGTRKDALGRTRTRSFRHAFLNAYAARIGERLREAADEAAGRAASRPDGSDLLPLLAARDIAVDDAVTALFPNLVRGRRGTVSNREGWLAGRAAADAAGLDEHAAVTEPSRGS
ncbi:DUF2786 domain-containing protein [Actinomadura flavalba]|uniref:DUF2786 domain-containing protein n=1 Tax=Actinomadura flavalba TaxID=1120938 RepID=UPI00036142FC|nr:DUF2786 domain-containing protein [Actinomadura flavalba]